MSTGAIVAIIVVILIAAALLVGLSVVNRRRRLRDRFGPEYDRAVSEHGSGAKPRLSWPNGNGGSVSSTSGRSRPTARAQYASEWTAVQEQFVDAPQSAVTGAQTLVSAVMKDRGYPTEALRPDASPTCRSSTRPRWITSGRPMTSASGLAPGPRPPRTCARR